MMPRPPALETRRQAGRGRSSHRRLYDRVADAEQSVTRCECGPWLEPARRDDHDDVARRTPSGCVGRERFAHTRPHFGDRVRRGLADRDRRWSHLQREIDGIVERARPDPIVSLRDSKSISARPAAARMPPTRSASANAKGPVRPAVAGRRRHVLQSREQRHRHPGVLGKGFPAVEPEPAAGHECLRKVRERGSRSWKNITPKREKMASKLPVRRHGSARRPRGTGRWRPRRRARDRVRASRSRCRRRKPSLGPTRRASANEVSPQPQPTSSTRSPRPIASRSMTTCPKDSSCWSRASWSFTQRGPPCSFQ